MGTRARGGGIVEVGVEVGVGARTKEGVAEAKVEVTLTAGAEVEVEVTHTAVREVDLTLPTILEAVPDRSHITRAPEADHTTPPTPILQGQGPERGLPRLCEGGALQASWTNDESRAHGNDRCPTTGRLQVHLPPRPRVEHRRAPHHQPGPMVDRRRGQAVENRIPPVMISPMLNCVISSTFKCSCSKFSYKKTRKFTVQKLWVDFYWLIVTLA